MLRTFLMLSLASVLSSSVAVVACLRGERAAASAQDPAKTAKIEDVPPAVRKTAEHFGEGGKIVKAKQTKEDGLPIWEIVLEKDGRTIEVQTTLDGQLFATEEKIDASTLPAATAARIAKLFPAGTKVSTERAMKVVFEVAAKKDGKTVEFLVDAAGVAFREVHANAAHEEEEEEEDETPAKK